MEITDDHKYLYEGLQKLVSDALSNNAIISNFFVGILIVLYFSYRDSLD